MHVNVILQTRNICLCYLKLYPDALHYSFLDVYLHKWYTPSHSITWISSYLSYLMLQNLFAACAIRSVECLEFTNDAFQKGVLLLKCSEGGCRSGSFGGGNLLFLEGVNPAVFKDGHGKLSCWWFSGSNKLYAGDAEFKGNLLKSLVCCSPRVFKIWQSKIRSCPLKNRLLIVTAEPSTLTIPASTTAKQHFCVVVRGCSLLNFHIFLPVNFNIFLLYESTSHARFI